MPKAAIPFLSTLYGKLTLSLLALVLVLGIAVLWVAQYTSDMYSQEVTQRLNSNIAMYVTAKQQLIKNGEVNQHAIDELAARVMTINPTVEVYLLDPQGKILTYLLKPSEVERSAVSLKPIRAFLAADQSLPIFGDDPRNPDVKKVFSVSPILDDGQVAGYLYAVLGGKKYDSLKNAVEQSFILKVGAIAILGSLALAVTVGLSIFFFLTRRLTDLRLRVESFQSNGLSSSLAYPINGNDEIDSLGRAFNEMAAHINEQFEALQSLDSTRRELVANVSHDLRTPLASMQGYIETLMIKDDDLTPEMRKHYLEIAYKHGQHLNQLIAELFELAKLDSGAVSLNRETFSLMELVYDCVQEFSLAAGEKEVKLDIEGTSDGCYVFADISLIQRVLQNLMANALQHTPAGHSVTIRVNNSDQRALVEVKDTGSGIASHEIPHIFERFYRSETLEPEDKIGAGLGLAIVKGILELHQSVIAVKSEINVGTKFSFELPLQAA